MSYNKYYTYKKQISYDGGTTWIDVFPNEFQPSGSPIGTYDTLEECEAPSLNGKYKFTLSGSSVVSAECDSTSAITSADTSAYEYTLIYADIGDCVTSIGNGAFGDCVILKRVNISNTVTSIGRNAFASCLSLTKIGIPNSVTSIGIQAFIACIALETMTIPDSVTSISGSAFLNCSGLTSVTIGSGIASIGGGAFHYCKNLSSITIEATTPPTLGSNAFGATSSNLRIYVPSESVEAYKSASGWSNYASRIQAIS